MSQMSEDDLRAVLDTLESLTAAQDDLAARIEALENAQRPSELDPDTLPEWVEWLRISYALENEIPAGWADVAGVPQELAGLRAAHAVAFDAEGNPLSGSDAVQWHDALQRVLGRIGQVWRSKEVKRRGGYTAAALARRNGAAENDS